MQSKRKKESSVQCEYREIPQPISDKSKLQQQNANKKDISCKLLRDGQHNITELQTRDEGGRGTNDKYIIHMDIGCIGKVRKKAANQTKKKRGHFFKIGSLSMHSAS